MEKIKYNNYFFNNRSIDYKTFFNNKGDNIVENNNVINATIDRKQVNLTAIETLYRISPNIKDSGLNDSHNIKPILITLKRENEALYSRIKIPRIYENTTDFSLSYHLLNLELFIKMEYHAFLNQTIQIKN